MEIQKATGEIERFSAAKLCESIEAAGAPEHTAQHVCGLVEKEIQPGTSTGKIFREALRHLVKEDLDFAANYSLRRAVSSLGPAGFLFEQFLEAVLQAHGYRVERNVILEGQCVAHEVDLRATRENTHYLIEAKYRNAPGIKTHIDVVMYADARLMDIERRQSKIEQDVYDHKMWVITNTKFTRKSIEYATCRKIRLTGWNYPKDADLQKFIREKKLYPVTVLPSLSKHAREQFAKHNMLLAQDVLPYDKNDLMQKFDIPRSDAERIIHEASEIVK